MTSTMFAITTTAEGFEQTTVDRPIPQSGEVLIEVAAVGINPADWKRRPAPADGARGIIMGWDVAGTVVAVAPGVTRFVIGDRVFGMPAFPAFAKSYAQFTVARARELARVPDGVSIVEAGAVPLAGLTAWQALVDTVHVKAGDRVLIHAAAGGVGHLAVQIAKHFGAEVWATASPRNHELLRELGADHLIDYRSKKFEDIAHDMDVVADFVGDGETARRSVATLRPGGQIVAISPKLPNAAEQELAGIRAHFLLVEPDYAALDTIAGLMAGGSLRVVIGHELPMAQMTELHDLIKRGGTAGKVVATIAS